MKRWLDLGRYAGAQALECRRVRGLAVIEVATGTRRDISPADRAMQASWSFGGSRVAFWGVRGESSQRDIWSLAADGSEADTGGRTVTDDAALDWNPVWSPDGRSNGTHVVCLVMPRCDASGVDASGAHSPAPPGLVVRADALMSRYPECFWSWRTDARIRSLDDVRLVVRQLREYGDREAWLAARDLARCLSQRSRGTS